jgi:hypothetical protein
MKSILDRTFRYTPAAETDLRKTFARIRRLQREREQREAKPTAEVINWLAKERK